MRSEIKRHQVRLVETMIETSKGIGRLGGVLGDVRSHCPGHRRVERHPPHVDLLVPPNLAVVPRVWR